MRIHSSLASWAGALSLCLFGSACSNDSTSSRGGTGGASTGGSPAAGAGGSAGGTAGTGGTASSAGGASNTSGGKANATGGGSSGGTSAGGASAGGSAGNGAAGSASGGASGAGGSIPGGAPNDAGTLPDGATGEGLSFFVSSQKNMTGDLGGLAGADMRCQTLAAAVGAGARKWRAYLSVASDPMNGGNPTHARDRIGSGPWFNAKGVMVAADVAALHARTGNADVFIDEHGAKINGQWQGSPTPNEHDILTGSTGEGMLMSGSTCADWTSTAASMTAQVGHSDGLGPNRNDQPPYSSWNSAHANGGCNNTAPLGGAGRIYCFAAD